jgi:hypothetical protein
MRGGCQYAWERVVLDCVSPLTIPFSYTSPATPGYRVSGEFSKAELSSYGSSGFEVLLPFNGAVYRLPGEYRLHFSYVCNALSVIGISYLQDYLLPSTSYLEGEGFYLSSRGWVLQTDLWRAYLYLRLYPPEESLHNYYPRS